MAARMIECMRRKKKPKDTMQPGSKIVRSEERIKKNAEIFTPPELVNEILDKLHEQDATLFTDPWKSFIDPSCGSGNFLVEVLKRKLANGHKPVVALMNLCGIDIMEDNVMECRQRLLELVGDHDGVLYGEIVAANIICGDALKEETRERFIDWERVVKDKQGLSEEDWQKLDAIGPVLVVKH